MGRHTQVLEVERIPWIQVNEEASDEVLVVEKKYTLTRRHFLSHPALGDLLNENCIFIFNYMIGIFKYLKSMDVEDCKDVKYGYSITFNFNENPYFENESLVKSFLFLDEGTTKISGTKINWKEGMDI
ncbi:hypothetical protein MKX03_001506 [Papaver bracteatum]|nr:hypothetical protein MKX03_001506 [Papaver bracteatum]